MSLPHGRAKVSSTSPRAFAICDRCGFLYNHRDLHWQYDFRGRSLANLRILVCETCEDTPQNQLKPRIIPPDPVPISNARPERYQQYETDTRTTQGNAVDFWTGLPVAGGDTRVTQTNNTRTTQATGEPPYGLDNTPGTSFQVPGNDELGATQGLPYGYTEIPQTGPLTPYSVMGIWGAIDAGQANWSNAIGGIVSWTDRAANPITTTWANNANGNINWANSVNMTVSWNNENWE
jgi:hypothetical protein